MMTIINLIRESKIKKISEGELWRALLKQKWDVKALKTTSCLNKNQTAGMIYQIGEELNLKYDWNDWIPREDLRLAVELYAALYFCSDKLKEGSKLSKLFESLITNESLNTVVAATIHNIQPRAGDNIKDFTAINMFFFVLARGQVNLLMYLTVESYVPTSMLSTE